VIPQTNKCGTGKDETAMGFIKIDIIDVNDNAPYFVPDRKQIGLSERSEINRPIPNSIINSYDKDTVS
jgi:hypothetical protein